MAMKMYTALSRIHKATDIFVTDLMSPCLFASDEFLWPSRLLMYWLSMQEGNSRCKDCFANPPSIDTYQCDNDKNAYNKTFAMAP
eukprot:9686879-Karenia_brevis.AAC.1